MRIYFILSILLLCSISYAQTERGSWFVEAQINPLFTSIDGLGVEERGAGFYDFNYREKHKAEFVFNVGRIMRNPRWRWGVGVSYTNMRYDYDYNLAAPEFSDQVDLSVIPSSNWNRSEYYGVRAFVEYEVLPRFSARLSHEAYNGTYNHESAYVRNLELFLYIVTLENGDLRMPGMSIDEHNRGNASFSLPGLMLSYDLLDNLSLTAGVKYSLFRRNEYITRLNIYYSGTSEFTDLFPEEHIIIIESAPDSVNLNNIVVRNKHLFLYAGIKYRFAFRREHR